MLFQRNTLFGKEKIYFKFHRPLNSLGEVWSRRLGFGVAKMASYSPLSAATCIYLPLTLSRGITYGISMSIKRYACVGLLIIIFY